MRKLSLTKWIISVLTIICFSVNIQAVTSGAIKDGATKAASLKLGDQATTAGTELYLYCGNPTSNEQPCKFLLHAVCPVKGITFDGSTLDSTCTLDITSITTATFSGNSGSAGSASAIGSIATDTTAAQSGAVSLAAGDAAHTLAIDALVTSGSSTISETLAAESGAIGPTLVAAPCVAFNADDAADVYFDGAWKHAASASDDTNLVYDILHDDNYSAPEIGFELTTYSAQISDRETVLGANDASFIVAYTFTVASHTTTAGQTC